MSVTPAHEVAVVGAGFAGLAMAIGLARQGVDDVVVLEKADDLGGTWRDNAYPGAACDVPSSLYSFSFAPKADWTHAFARQAQIWEYLREVADRFGVDGLVRYGAHVTSAEYDEANATWRLGTASGERLTARTLVLATGALSVPDVPDLPGLGDFDGPAFHSATWPRGDDGLTGRRVAVIGTGASAVQLVPELAGRVAHQTVFQRTPAWTLPKIDRRFPAWEQRLYGRVPAVQRMARAGVFVRLESRMLAFTGYPGAMRAAEVLAREHLRRQVRDPAVRAALTPTYRIGCKRILLSNDYWAAFDRPDVELVPSAAVRVVDGAVVDGEGRHHEVDAIVFGTGFTVTEPHPDLSVTGPGGVTLEQTWRHAMEGYLGVAVAGFPNLFTLVGPNSGLAHSSMVFIIERQVAYVLQAMRLRDASGAASVSVRADAQRTFNDDVQRRTVQSVWGTGCRSWYLDAGGRNRALWPASALTYWRRTARPRAADLELAHPTPGAAPTSRGCPERAGSITGRTEEGV